MRGLLVLSAARHEHECALHGVSTRRRLETEARAGFWTLHAYGDAAHTITARSVV